MTTPTTRITILGKELDYETNDNKQAYNKQVDLESDVIITSVIIGFILTRFYQNQPCQFDIEHPTLGEELLLEYFSSGEDAKKQIEQKVEKLLLENIKCVDANFFKQSLKAINLLTMYSEGDEAKQKEAEATVASVKKHMPTSRTVKLFEKYKNLKDINYGERIVEDFVKEMELNSYNLLDALSFVVGCEVEIGSFIKDGQSPFGSEGKLITGKQGSATESAKKRNRPLTYSKADMIKNAIAEIEIDRNKKAPDQPTIYTGRGAYTGLVDNPISANHKLFPTRRVNVTTYTMRKWQGKTVDSKNEPRENWGLIGWDNPDQPNLKPLPKGFGQINNDKIKVAYIHGMCSAIVESSKYGPWCTPYEMATGTETTKMASCFPCSTYMYSTGFPPSSIHLGRGESWVPPHSCKVFEQKLGQPVDESLFSQCEIADAFQKGWNRDIYHQMKIGLDCMLKAEKYIDNDHYPLVSDTKDRLQQLFGNDPGQPYKLKEVNASGGGLFLDALSNHDSEIKRLTRTLKPALDVIKVMTKHSYT
ncbi:hypothetical protein [Paraferrimonas sp. SM1919]|uniref:hypothetical protein n=1 Tax=Paraferrimonas sp. SM1919 TaxID=2662263 RepID=UPI0013D264A3|nr:hypothetical protein [Paraferrimonas sp. SM1919]